MIAELKRRSPTKGTLNDALDPRSLSALFEQGGAVAISVLTEPVFFGGCADDIEAVRSTVRLPVLRKDFHVHVAQLKQAQAEQASAVLLIARALPPEDLPDLMQQARTFGLEVVVEVRSEAELERALEAGADIVGVNSRDLETLEVDERVPQRLIPRIPRGVLAIWESGVASVADVQRAADSGADAVLVGSALSQSSDPAGMVRSLTHVPRRRAVRNG